MNLVEGPRTNPNRTNTAPATAPAADPAAALNGGAGGISGLLQMLMQFIQQLFGGAGGGLGNFFSGLMGQETSQMNEGGAGPGRDGQSPTPSPRNDFARNAGVASIPPDGRFDSRRALAEARSDDARVGYCAKGTANILEDQGYRVARGDAHDWDRTLPQNGWVKLSGVNARNAPEGAVLVYDSDVHQGQRARNDGGGRFGHAEVVCYDAQGNRKYVSDAARSNPGGTVPDNFVGAYIPRERYENYLAQRREQAGDTMVARNDTSSNNRNTSVAAADGAGIRAESLTASFTAADQRHQLAAGPMIAAPQPGVAPAPGMA